MTRRLTLVGDGIENPWNAVALQDAAAMFASDCCFRDRAGLVAGWEGSTWQAELCLTDPATLSRDCGPIIALENEPGAADIYGYRLPDGPRPALIVGNERRGIARDMLTVAQQAVEIPMAARGINTLNVAAAAAVGLYYLTRNGGGRMQIRAQPERRRPELLLLGPLDHVEAGSAIRSAAAFGWQRVLLEDRARVWFGVERGRHAEGRAAARRARNRIQVVPMPSGERLAFDEVCVVTTSELGVPLSRSSLARGPRQVLVIPDEATLPVAAQDWERLGRNVTFVRPELPGEPRAVRYRLLATIVLAEAARQIGRRAPAARAARRTPRYDRALETLPATAGEFVDLDELAVY